jgi:hypothetical protein
VQVLAPPRGVLPGRPSAQCASALNHGCWPASATIPAPTGLSSV